MVRYLFSYCTYEMPRSVTTGYQTILVSGKDPDDCYDCARHILKNKYGLERVYLKGQIQSVS